MKFGEFDVTPLLDGHFRLDGGAMYGNAPRAVWERWSPPDARHRIAHVVHGFLDRLLQPELRRLLGAVHPQPVAQVGHLSGQRAGEMHDFNLMGVGED